MLLAYHINVAHLVACAHVQGNSGMK